MAGNGNPQHFPIKFWPVKKLLSGDIFVGKFSSI